MLETLAPFHEAYVSKAKEVLAETEAALTALSGPDSGSPPEAAVEATGSGSPGGKSAGSAASQGLTQPTLPTTVGDGGENPSVSPPSVFQQQRSSSAGAGAGSDDDEVDPSFFLAVAGSTSAGGRNWADGLTTPKSPDPLEYNGFTIVAQDGYTRNSNPYLRMNEIAVIHFGKSLGMLK